MQDVERTEGLGPLAVLLDDLLLGRDALDHGDRGVELLDADEGLLAEHVQSGVGGRGQAAQVGSDGGRDDEDVQVPRCDQRRHPVAGFDAVIQSRRQVVDGDLGPRHPPSGRGDDGHAGPLEPGRQERAEAISRAAGTEDACAQPRGFVGAFGRTVHPPMTRHGRARDKGGVQEAFAITTPPMTPRTADRKNKDKSRSASGSKSKDSKKEKGKSKEKRPDKKSKKGKDGKPKKKNKPTLASQADRHELYEKAVQGPEEDTKFFRRYYKKVTGRLPRTFREDFCGTATLSAHWVKLDPSHEAYGVDLHGPTLDWGRKRNIEPLTDDQQSRIHLIQDDVCAVKEPQCDIVCALNFSYGVFKTRDALRGYIQAAFDATAPGGIYCCDAWGGGDTQIEMEEEREVEGFTYIWEQSKFDPMSYNTVCKIHFEMKDGSRIDDAFVYDWRLWTLPELRELFEEVGFTDVHMLWEGTDPDTDEGNGEFRRRKTGDADAAWIAYVVGVKPS